MISFALKRLAALGAIAVLPMACAPGSSVVTPSTSSQRATQSGPGGGGGAAPGGGGGGGVNFGLSGKFVPDAAFPAAFGNFRVQRAGAIEKLSGDVVQTGLPGTHFFNGIESSTWITVALNGAPYMVSKVLTAAEFGGLLPKTECPDVTNTSTDCVPIIQEFNRAPGGAVPTVPALVAGSRLDFTAINADGVVGVSLFDPSIPVVGHLGFVILK